MSVRWYLICFGGLIVILKASCSHEEEKGIDEHLQNVVETWVQAEVLHQKWSAEGKYKDSIRCFKISDNMSVSQRESLMIYWSEHPEELRKIVMKLVDKK